jgi:NAD-dependent deacetylase
VIVIKLERLFELIDQSNKIVFFGGAGVSTASGIPDFRSTDGLYHLKYAYRPETILSHSFFMQKTKEFYEFYFDKMIYLDVLPNYCHKALAYLEEKGKLTSVITQNIDGLHQLAGSKKVLELHGSVHRNYTVKTNRFYSLDYILNNRVDGIPYAEDGELIKPDVVLYEEPLDHQTLMDSIKEVSQADLLIVGGTSLTVYPASGLINYFRGHNLVIINKSKIPFYEGLQINEDINLVFKKYLEHVGVIV